MMNQNAALKKQVTTLQDEKEMLEKKIEEVESNAAIERQGLFNHVARLERSLAIIHVRRVPDSGISGD